MKWPFGLNKLFKPRVSTTADLKAALRDANHNRLISIDALSMIEGVMQTADMRVDEIMVPRSKMVVIEKDAAIEDILPIVVQSAHSRFPVVGDSYDEIVGILLAKDLLNVVNANERFNLKDILRPATFIPDTKRLDVLLAEFRQKRNHLAMVVDEYGGVLGLITIEDVLEQIVGEITDEHDKEEERPINKHSDGTYTVKANIELDIFNEAFGTHLSHEVADTIGGYVTKQLGHIPERGEQIRISGALIEVLHADTRRCHLLRIEPVASISEEG